VAVEQLRRCLEMIGRLVAKLERRGDGDVVVSANGFASVNRSPK
jgi:hypothetical protein